MCNGFAACDRPNVPERGCRLHARKDLVVLVHDFCPRTRRQCRVLPRWLAGTALRMLQICRSVANCASNIPRGEEEQIAAFLASWVEVSMGVVLDVLGCRLTADSPTAYSSAQSTQSVAKAA